MLPRRLIRLSERHRSYRLLYGSLNSKALLVVAGIYAFLSVDKTELCYIATIEKSETLIWLFPRIICKSSSFIC